MNDNKKERWKKLLEEEQKKTESQEETKSEPATRTGLVTNHPKVNVRARPSMDAKILMVADIGTKFEILEEMPNWFKIQLNDNLGRVGYISSTFFTDLSKGAWA